MAKIDLNQLAPQLQEAIRRVTHRRPRLVVEHILEYGYVTTEDLQQMGYKHPPRAARDVRECGIPLITSRITGSQGKKIASYTFGDPSEVEGHKLSGRQLLPKKLRNDLFAAQGGRCAVCGHTYEIRYLQIDHRVPYEIAGEAAPPTESEHFMLLCASCQRKKSWSCERCENWRTKERATCTTCLWADPANHRHVAMEQVRSVTITLRGTEAEIFDDVQSRCSPEEIAEAARRAILDLAGRS
ncbi:MAG: HNH endonuclease [Myxococcales bacterium]|nr:HNH endonuclease [Myxococcales bacterium]